MCIVAIYPQKIMVVADSRSLFFYPHLLSPRVCVCALLFVSGARARTIFSFLIHGTMTQAYTAYTHSEIGIYFYNRKVHIIILMVFFFRRSFISKKE